MKTKTLLTTVLAAAVAMLNAENITVGWPLYPVARKLIAQYEKTIKTISDYITNKNRKSDIELLTGINKNLL